MAKYDSIRVYLPPFYKKLADARAEFNGQSASSVVADAVKKVFDEIPMNERERMLRHAEVNKSIEKD